MPTKRTRTPHFSGEQHKAAPPDVTDMLAPLAKDGPMRREALRIAGGDARRVTPIRPGLAEVDPAIPLDPTWPRVRASAADGVRRRR